MSRRGPSLGFERSTLRIPLDQIAPLREVGDSVRQSAKYAQIKASIREVGIIEPPVVTRDGEDGERDALRHQELRRLRAPRQQERGHEDAGERPQGRQGLGSPGGGRGEYLQEGAHARRR